MLIACRKCHAIYDIVQDNTPTEEGTYSEDLRFQGEVVYFLLDSKPEDLITFYVNQCANCRE